MEADSREDVPARLLHSLVMRLWAAHEDVGVISAMSDGVIDGWEGNGPIRLETLQRHLARLGDYLRGIIDDLEGFREFVVDPDTAIADALAAGRRDAEEVLRRCRFRRGHERDVVDTSPLNERDAVAPWAREDLARFREAAEKLERLVPSALEPLAQLIELTVWGAEDPADPAEAKTPAAAEVSQ